MRGTVTTNGIFDLIHVGHISLLKYAASFGDFLIVLINSDASAGRVRGHVPVFSQAVRRTVLESIRYVDRVVIYDEDDPLVALAKIRPAFHVTGRELEDGDAGGKMTESDVVEEYGGRVIVAPELMIGDARVSGDYIRERLEQQTSGVKVE